MHDFIGRWRIVWMENWAQEFVDLVEPRYFEFTEDHSGRFVFCAVYGFIDVRVNSQRPFLEYSWQGKDDRDDACGRGWFEFDTPSSGEGKLFIHCGDESVVKIERET